MAIALFNSKLNPGWILIADAKDAQKIGNLNLMLLYLPGKMTADGIKERTKEDQSNGKDTLNERF